MSNIPNAEQKRWLKRVAQYANDHGCFPLGGFAPFQLHHVAGRSAKHNKVHIGHWFVLPIETSFHDVMSNNPLNVTHFRKRYVNEFGPQAKQFCEMINKIRNEDGIIPFGDDVIDSILDSRF